LDSLSLIDSAIQKFRIRGIVHLEEALIRIAGEMSYLYPDVVKSVTSETKPSAAADLFRRLMGICGHLSALIKISPTVAKALSAGVFVYKLLVSGDTVPPVDLDPE